MRIGFISDLHIDYNRYKGVDFVEELVQLADEARLDVLGILGDTANGACDALSFYDALAHQMSAQLRIVAGNHDLYVADAKKMKAEAVERRSHEFYRMLMDHAAYSLARNPIVTKNWLIAGVAGWYDYSFARGYPDVDIEKVARNPLVKRFWPDAQMIFGGRIDPCRDERWVETDLDGLERIFSNPAYEAKRRCVAMHTLPTKALITPKPIPLYHVFVNMLGSEKYRRFFEANDVSLCVCGHSHMMRQLQFNAVHYVNVSLGYRFQWKRKRAQEELRRALFVLEDVDEGT